ncbi:hypothetical protein ACFX5U_01960 [Sphingobacterium sp. SG20118]|uniref:hypothetical protein n=1 Tax=Sphingobacterium sp. SG20118 TaxID=3367156 RepID=UPI0037DFC74C
MASIFQFKKFAVDQSDCAMKINTDGVLLASLVDVGSSARILDIGTGNRGHCFDVGTAVFRK